MGSLASAIEELTESKEQKELEIKERLEFLGVAAKAKLNGYRNEANEAFLNPEAVKRIQIPGKRAIKFFEQYHISASKELNSQVGDHLDRAVNAFFSIGDSAGSDTEGKDNKDSVKKGLQSLIQIGLSTFIGSTEAGESEERLYFIVPENNAFIRADIYCWRYNFAQSNITTDKDTAIAYLLVKSVVDHGELTVDELIYFATESLVGRSKAEYSAADIIKQLDIINGDAALTTTLQTEPASLPTLTATAETSKKALTQLAQMNVRIFPVNSKTDKVYKTQYSYDSNFPILGAAMTPDLKAVTAYIDSIMAVWSRLAAAKKIGYEPAVATEPMK